MSQGASPPGRVVTSAANPRIRAAIALRDRRERDRTSLTLIDGAREVRCAFDAGVIATDVFLCEPRLAGGDARAVLDRIAAAGTRVTSVSEAVLAKLAFGERADGIVAIVAIPPLDLVNLTLAADPLVVVIEGVEKPGNIGAVLRSADGAGVDALILADARTDPFNPNAIRASAGTVFSVPLAVATTEVVVPWLRARGLRVVAARPDADRLYTEIDLTGPIAIALGTETEGLTSAWAGAGFEAVRLPMLGVADSLNVSVSAGILLYEARRQRAAL
jgi:TrmH family RNA methyltransferase